MTLNFGNTLFPSRSDFTAQFDYRDILTGNGYVEYFGGAAYDSSKSLNYILQSERFDTADISEAATESTYYTALTDNATTTINFDVNVAVTSQLFGKVNCEFLVHTGTSGNLSSAKATLKKGAETILIIGETTVTGNGYSRISLSEELITTKVLKKGDILRLTLDLAYSKGTSSNEARLYHDPNNRETITSDSIIEKTAMILNIPFKVII